MCSSRALHQMNSSMSGWSTSSTTILAARRVLPPDLIVPADASAPRMNETGPEAWPPFESCSFEERSRERLTPEPEPPRKMIPSRRIQSRIDSIESSIERMKQLWTATLLDRYSPDSVWMSYTSCTPTGSIETTSSSRRSGQCLSPRSESDSSSFCCFVEPAKPTSSAKRARSEPIEIATSNVS